MNRPCVLYRTLCIIFTSLIVVAIPGCAHKAPPLSPAKLADPKTAAQTFAEAVDRGDIATARAASIGPEQQQWVESMAAMSGGLRAVAAAITARFDGRGVATSGSLITAAHTLTGETVDALKAADANVRGDTAIMVAANNEFATSRLKSVSVLRRDSKGLWHVDLPEVFKRYPVLEAERTSSVLSRYRGAGKTLQSIAKDIRSGKYKTIEDAQRAIAERVGE